MTEPNENFIEETNTNDKSSENKIDTAVSIEDPPAENPVEKLDSIVVENSADTGAVENAVEQVADVPSENVGPSDDVKADEKSDETSTDDGHEQRHDDRRPDDRRGDDRRYDRDRDRRGGGGGRGRGPRGDRPMTNEEKLRMYKKQSEERLLDIKRSKEMKIGKKRKR